MAKIIIRYEEIEKAQRLLRKSIDVTPLIYNRLLSEKYQCNVFLKLENMQPVGSFKIRGATYKISKLSKAQRKKGVVTASAGNHAQGVAWGCARFNVNAKIVMPKNAPLTKIQNTEQLGAEVILEGENYDQAHAYARELEKKGKATFVHPYDDEDVIAGQGTIALELLDQLNKIDVVIGAMGGGGLMAGVGSVFKHLSPKTNILGVQAQGACSLVESIRKKRVVSTGVAETFADGIKVIQPSKRMVELLSDLVDETSTATDEQIARAVLSLAEKAKIVAEGSGALPLAVLDNEYKKFKNQNVVLIITGGNIDVNILARIIDTGLIHSGRRVRLNVYISDRPGSLNKLTQLIANEGANILQAIHDRDSPKVNFTETLVELTLETRGRSYTEKLVKLLRKEVARLEVMQ